MHTFFKRRSSCARSASSTTSVASARAVLIPAVVLLRLVSLVDNHHSGFKSATLCLGYNKAKFLIRSPQGFGCFLFGHLLFCGFMTSYNRNQALRCHLNASYLVAGPVCSPIRHASTVEGASMKKKLVRMNGVAALSIILCCTHAADTLPTDTFMCVALYGLLLAL